jgi:hypothetical protein
MWFSKRDWRWLAITVVLTIVLVALQGSRISLSESLRDAKSKSTFEGDLRLIDEQAKACHEFVQQRARGAGWVLVEKNSNGHYFIILD